MPGPYPIAKRAVMGAAIDTALGTTEAAADTTTIDLLLGWMTATAQQLAALQTRVTTLESSVAALQADMSQVIAKG